MKTILLSLATFFSVSIFGQTTHNLDWHLNFTSPASDLVISVGDTVKWTWTDAAPHTVKSNVGSAETFTSTTLSGVGQTYSHTFTTAGNNPYFCSIHGAASMSGTITVKVLATEETNAESEVNIYPNPTSDLLNISKMKSTIKSVYIYDLAGKKIKSIEGYDIEKNSKIDVSGLETGTYIIEILADKNVIRKQFIKK